MSLYIQHGYGKSDKITTLAATGSVRGLLLSPADEDVSVLRRTADDARNAGLRVYIDPQTYIYSTSPRGLGRNHDAHGIQFDDLHWSQDPRELADQVAKIGLMHEQISPGAVKIAPTVLQTSFEDVWTSTAFQLARSAAASWGRDKTIATLAIEESALSTWQQVDAWLDVATTLDVRGFYILVVRQDTKYPTGAWPVDRLANLMRLVYTLSELNGYEVCWGYSDSDGLMGLAAGASALATGWSYSLRQFRPSKWQPSESKFARQATPRFYARSLWTPLLAEAEAANILESSLGESVFTVAEREAAVAAPLGQTSGVAAQLQHIASLAAQAKELSSLKEIPDRLDKVEGDLAEAARLLAEVEARRIPVSSRYGSRIASLREAMVRFRAAESL